MKYRLPRKTKKKFPQGTHKVYLSLWLMTKSSKSFSKNLIKSFQFAFNVMEKLNNVLKEINYEKNTLNTPNL